MFYFFYSHSPSAVHLEPGGQQCFISKQQTPLEYGQQLNPSFVAQHFCSPGHSLPSTHTELNDNLIKAKSNIKNKIYI